MKINSKIVAISIFLIVFGGIALAKMIGFWHTTGSGRGPRAIAKGVSAGLPNPQDIKGSYTLKDVADFFDIPKKDLARAFLIDEEQLETFKVKDIKTHFVDAQREIGVASVRAFVAFYKGIDVELSEEAFLPKQAVDVILENGKPTKRQIQYMKTHVLEVSK